MVSFIASDLPETSLCLKVFVSARQLTSHHILHTHAGLLCIVTIIMIARIGQQTFLFGILGLLLQTTGPCVACLNSLRVLNQGAQFYVWSKYSFCMVRLQYTFSLCSMSFSFESYNCFPSVRPIIVTFWNMTWFLQSTGGNYSSHLALLKYVSADCLRPDLLCCLYFLFSLRNWEKIKYAFLIGQQSSVEYHHDLTIPYVPRVAVRCRI